MSNPDQTEDSGSRRSWAHKRMGTERYVHHGSIEWTRE